LNRGDLRFNLEQNLILNRNGRLVFMSAATGTDWTRILSDPDLVRHVGKLLQAYREAPVEKRESALLDAMREIKAGAQSNGRQVLAKRRPMTMLPNRIPWRLRPQPRPRLSPICSAPISAAIAAATPASSASSR
jgi:hypothetical protein